MNYEIITINNNNYNNNNNKTEIGIQPPFMDQVNTEEDNNTNSKQQEFSTETTTVSNNIADKETPIIALLQESSGGVELKPPSLSALNTSTTTTNQQQQLLGGVEMRLKSPATALSSIQQQHHHSSIPPATGGGVVAACSPTKKTTPTTATAAKTEDDYIKSDKLHTYHGRTTHYYRDEPKNHEMLLSVKVKHEIRSQSIRSIHRVEFAYKTVTGLKKNSKLHHTASRLFEANLPGSAFSNNFLTSFFKLSQEPKRPSFIKILLNFVCSVCLVTKHERM